MIVSAIAHRYARALADVSIEMGIEDKVDQDLEFLAAALRISPELNSVLRNPSIPREKKIDLLEALWSRKGDKPNEQTFNLISMLLKNNRMGLAQQIHSAFQVALNEKLGIVTAEVITRFEMRQVHRTRLEQRLEEITGKRVNLDFSQEESIIGGVILRMGSTLYDGSIRQQLAAIQTRLGSE